MNDPQQLPQAEPDASCTNAFTMETPSGEQEIVNVKPPSKLRYKALATNKDTLLALLLLNHEIKDRATFPLHMVDCASLPKDVAIEDVIYDWTREQFQIVISSPEFPELEASQPIPVLDLPVETWTVGRVKEDQVILGRWESECALRAMMWMKANTTEDQRDSLTRRESFIVARADLERLLHKENHALGQVDFKARAEVHMRLSAALDSKPAS